MNLTINPEQRAYQPKGRVLLLLPLMRAEPNRVFKADEIARIIKCDSKAVGATMEHPIANGLVYRMKFKGDRAVYYKGSPFDGQEVKAPKVRKRSKAEYFVRIQDGWTTTMDDPRVPKVVAGWVPPKMVCTRFQQEGI